MKTTEENLSYLLPYILGDGWRFIFDQMYSHSEFRGMIALIREIGHTSTADHLNEAVDIYFEAYPENDEAMQEFVDFPPFLSIVRNGKRRSLQPTITHTLASR